MNDFLSNFLREKRKEEGLTQKQISEKLEIPRGNWANYETGRAEISGKLLLKAFKILHVSAQDICNMIYKNFECASLACFT